MIQVTILGCGSSLGTPVLGCKCHVCTSQDPKNKRSRSAVLFTSHQGSIRTNILVDSGFDIRSQLLRAGIDQLDAAIITHGHADHISGIDELRIFSQKDKTLPIYINGDGSDKIISHYRYLFKNKSLDKQIINYYTSVNICGIEMKFFRQDHVVMDSLGIRIGNFVYANDVAFFYEKSLPYLRNIEILVIDCCDYTSTKVHAGLDRVLTWLNQFKPKITYLTNLSHKIDYNKIKKELPSNVYPAYDGLVFQIQK